VVRELLLARVHLPLKALQLRELRPNLKPNLKRRKRRIGEFFLNHTSMSTMKSETSFSTSRAIVLFKLRAITSSYKPVKEERKKKSC
jgi:hypothetical protein